MHRLHEGDCLDVLPAIPSGSIDCVVTDPPYPEIGRDYGRWTVAEWPECRRVLKPKGSAGRMRTWPWDFLAKWGREWGVVQDAYWWNTGALPLAGACKEGLMRPAARLAVWLGPDASVAALAELPAESAPEIGEGG